VLKYLMFSTKLATPEGLLPPMTDKDNLAPTADSQESEFKDLRTVYSHRSGSAAQRWIEQKRGAAALPPCRGDWVYFIKEWGRTGRIKIGYSTDVAKRLVALQTGTSAQLFVAGWTAGTRATERAIHSLLSDFHVRGEWYVAGPKVLDFVLAVHGRETPDDAAIAETARKCLSRRAA